MKKKKILIIGGAGFIGHNLALYLKRKKFEILAIDDFKINNFEYVAKEIKDNLKRKLYTKFLKERVELLKKNKIKLNIYLENVFVPKTIESVFLLNIS